MNNPQRLAARSESAEEPFTTILDNKTLLRRAGLPDRRLHDLRHTFATLMFRRGLDVVMVSRMLGHASVQITIDIYIHWLPKDSSAATVIGDTFLRGRGERRSAQ
jgi:integrase